MLAQDGRYSPPQERVVIASAFPDVLRCFPAFFGGPSLHKREVKVVQIAPEELVLVPPADTPPRVLLRRPEPDHAGIGHALNSEHTSGLFGITTDHIEHEG